MSITASEARRELFGLIRQVNDDHAAVEITSRGGDAVLMSAEDYAAWQETVYLLRSPANARQLMEAVARYRADPDATIRKSFEELEAMAVPERREQPETTGESDTSGRR